MNHIPATRDATGDDDQLAAERLEQEFSRCQDQLLGTLYYLVGNIEDARDALQETFVKCWRHRRRMGEIENLRAWIFRVALNAGRDLRSTAWRRRRRPLENEETVLAAGHGNPDQATAESNAIRREQLALVREALAELRPEEQEVFLLRQNAEMTYQQIAESINLPIGTVKTRMRLAITKLRGALQT